MAGVEQRRHDPVWRRDGRELYYLTPAGDLVAVAVDPESTFTLGKSTTLFRLRVPPTPQGAPYDAATDGQRFLFALAPRNASTPITAILNGRRSSPHPGTD